MANYAESLGANRESILKSTGLDEAFLSKEKAYVDYPTLDAVFQNIWEQLEDDCFGLHLGEHIDLKATAYVDQLMAKSATIESAFENAVVYSRLISDSMDCSLEVLPDSFLVNYDLNPNWILHSDYAIRQNLDVAILCALRSIHRLSGNTHYPQEVNFNYPKPSKLNEYYRVFNCHLNFNQKTSSIVFAKYLLKTKVQGQDSNLLRILMEQGDQLLKDLDIESGIIYEVKKALLENIQPHSFRIQTVAEKMNLSPRTLQRKIKKAGSRFSDIQTDIRIKLCLKLLNTGNDNLDEIAYLIGYSEGSALIRAFKNQTGFSPKNYLKYQSLLKNS